MARALRLGLWVSALGAVLLIAAIILYTIQNRSGHTGWEPFTSFVVFAPLAAAGGGLFLGRRRWPDVARASVAALVVGVTGMGLVVWLDQSNRLVQYERWLKRDMP